ncbi:glycosyltransferase [Amycolatopsis sp. H20-H5]|uniref:glycosyltransferase n=1 Tax=Amycolatopsis sp. H20-H5 TaxID=3046309 RepID=UPI002DBBE1D0|nr:glycosyltransferase [Amycolatopsis sp. H20-H5]MEC3977096.1 glycosyltransferase [Amycolatopsis sp. H20-H5]
MYPLLPLATAARDAGHEVVFGTGETFLPRLRDLGFEAHRVGISVSEAEDEARRRHGEDVTEVLFTMFCDVLPHATLADVEPLLDRLTPELVVYEMSDAGAGAGARRAGIPAVAQVIGRSMPPAVIEESAKRLAWLWDGDLPADPLMGDACVDVWPDSLRDPVAAALPVVHRMRQVPWTEDVPLPAVVSDRKSRPLVYLTLGTMAFGATEVFRAAIDGLSRLPVDVLVAVRPGNPSALGPVPASVRVERFVPQTEVLAHADLAVHHGGTGTVLGSLSAGLPQLILPQGADQFINADTVSELGAARSLRGEAITADAVEEHARVLLTDQNAREAARSVGAEIAALPSPAEVVRLLTNS